MKKFIAIEVLLQDAIGESEYLNEYKDVQKLGDDLKLYAMRTPSRQRIYDDLKAIRRLTFKIEKEMRS